MGTFLNYLNPLPHRCLLILANRADPDQAGSALFAFRNMIRYDPTLVDLASNFLILIQT